MIELLSESQAASATRPMTRRTCRFVACPFATCTFPLTPELLHDSLSLCSKTGFGSRPAAAAGEAEADPEAGKKRGNEKKMFFRGNELSHLLQPQDLAFLECSKRTGF